MWQSARSDKRRFSTICTTRLFSSFSWEERPPCGIYRSPDYLTKAPKLLQTWALSETWALSKTWAPQLSWDNLALGSWFGHMLIYSPASRLPFQSAAGAKWKYRVNIKHFAFLLAPHFRHMLIIEDCKTKWFFEAKPKNTWKTNLPPGVLTTLLLLLLVL